MKMYIKTRTKKLFHGMIIVNMEKLEMNVALFSYIALYIAHKLTILASVIMGIFIIAAGGDGKYSDGSLSVMLTSMALCLVCVLATRVISIMMRETIDNYKTKHNRKNIPQK